MQTPITIEDILSDPSASNWLKIALKSAVLRDPIDAASDAEILAKVLDHHAHAVLAEAQGSAPPAAISSQSTHQTSEPFQNRVRPWLLTCFGAAIASDKGERNNRFLEEAIELVQACGGTQGEAHQLVDYVYGRPVGDPTQEVGGVMLTLAALCLAQGLDMQAAGESELDRVWTKVEQIRAKQAAKPRNSPLPA